MLSQLDFCEGFLSWDYLHPSHRLYCGWIEPMRASEQVRMILKNSRQSFGWLARLSYFHGDLTERTGLI